MGEGVETAEGRSRWHTPEGGFETVDATAAAGNANRAAAIGSHRQGAHAGCHRRRASPTRPSWGVVEAPGVSAQTEHRVIGDALVPELRGVGFAEDNGARQLEPFNDWGIL